MNCQMQRLAAEAQSSTSPGRRVATRSRQDWASSALGQAIIDRQSAVALLVQVVGTEGSGDGHHQAGAVEGDAGNPALVAKGRPQAGLGDGNDVGRRHRVPTCAYWLSVGTLEIPPKLDDVIPFVPAVRCCFRQPELPRRRPQPPRDNGTLPKTLNVPSDSWRLIPIV